MITIESNKFGTTKYGETVTKFILKNECGISVSVLDYGCTLVDLCVPSRFGEITDVCLGYDTIEEYENNFGFFGAVVGRHANRIGEGMFVLNGQKYTLALNNGPNHLHGGIRGFDKYVWDASVGENCVVFSRLSPDGEEGYPGNLSVKVTYTLSDSAFTIAYEAQSDADTVVNLTNHAYFNLGGHNSGSILEHRLQIFADSFTESDPNCLPTGLILPVSGTPFDFTQPKAVGKDIEAEDIQLKYGRGYDQNFVLSDRQSVKKAAVLACPATGISMTVHTTLPGLQIYTGNGLHEIKGKNGVVYPKHGGMCLETQLFPNAMVIPHFPSPVLKKGEIMKTETEFRFGIQQ